MLTSKLARRRGARTKTPSEEGWQRKALTQSNILYDAQAYKVKETSTSVQERKASSTTNANHDKKM
jgi:hypothetical protein